MRVGSFILGLGASGLPDFFEQNVTHARAAPGHADDQVVNRFKVRLSPRYLPIIFAVGRGELVRANMMLYSELDVRSASEVLNRTAILDCVRTMFHDSGLAAWDGQLRRHQDEAQTVVKGPFPELGRRR